MLLSWLMRPSDASLARQAEFRRINGWATPIVGVHVRRTDKLDDEAFLHSIEEYMRHVERHCDLHLPSGWQQDALRAADAAKANTHAAGAGDTAGAAPPAHVLTSRCSVYLASDEPAVAAEVREKYRHIHLIINELGLKSGAHGASARDSHYACELRSAPVEQQQSRLQLPTQHVSPACWRTADIDTACARNLCHDRRPCRRREHALLCRRPGWRHR